MNRRQSELRATCNTKQESRLKQDKCKKVMSIILNRASFDTNKPKY